MFSRHVTKDISAYCHGELSSDDSKKFAEHIISCAKCRTKYEEVKVGIKFAEQLPQLSAPEHLWRDIEPLLDEQGETSPDVVTTRRFGIRAFPMMPFAAAAAAILITVGGFLWYYSNLPSPTLPSFQPGLGNVMAQPSWHVQRLDGSPRIGTERISDSGQLEIGDVLETDGRSRARISVGSIGNVDIDENTRVRLLATKPTEHRLELARGKMSARIWAPPKLFFVDTPSAVAADMGCAYTLEVDDHGGSLLRVTSGWVALQLEDRESIVPAGAACETRKGFGPGTPYFVDATPEFRETLRKIDFNQDPRKTPLVNPILNEARPRDTLTLWHLLPRVSGDDRARVYDRLAAFAAPPDGVTREGVLMLDQKMLALWRQALELDWIGGSGKGSFKKGSEIQGGLSKRLKDMSPK